METSIKGYLTAETLVNAPAAKAWELFTAPEHIMQWYQATPDWHAPYADNELREGGRFKTTMAARDGSFSFDFSGAYTRVVPLQALDYTLDDGRKVEIRFSEETGGTRITERFQPESQNSEELQRSGWQAILDSFREYVATKV